MKIRKLLILSTIGIMCLTGCSKTEKDTSYDTNLYGTYVNELQGENYEQKTQYTFNSNDTYKYTYSETINGKTKDTSRNHLINNIKKINNDITKIELNTDDSERSIYKYKNMLGQFYEVEVPDSENFNLKIKNPGYSSNAGYVYNKNGLWHPCANLDDCNCKDFFITYKRKGNYIYGKNSEGDYYILHYIVDGGLFYPEYYKEED